MKTISEYAALRGAPSVRAASGLLLLIYAGALVLVTDLLAGVQAVLWLFAPPPLAFLPILLVILYASSGAAALLGRAWALRLAGYTAIAQLFLCSAAGILLGVISGDTLAGVTLAPSGLPVFLTWVPPAVIVWFTFGPGFDVPAIARPIVAGVCAALLLVTVWLAWPQATWRTTIGTTTLCIPAEYMVDGSRRLLDIPDAVFSTRLSGYQSSIDQNMRLHGVLHAREAFARGLPVERLWIAGTGESGALVQADPQFPGFRIRRHPGNHAGWYLVASRPPEVADGPAPDDWYVGYCPGPEMPGMDACTVAVGWGELVLSLPVRPANLHLHAELEAIARELMAGWVADCQ